MTASPHTYQHLFMKGQLMLECYHCRPEEVLCGLCTHLNIVEISSASAMVDWTKSMGTSYGSAIVCSRQRYCVGEIDTSAMQRKYEHVVDLKSRDRNFQKHWQNVG